MIKYIETHKNKIAVIIIGLIVLSFVLTCTDGCNKGKRVVITPTNQLNEIVKDKDAIILQTMENNKVLRDSLFTLLQRKPVVIIRKVKVYDSLLIADTACINSLVTLYNQCAKVDSVNEYIIANQSNQIAELVTVTNAQNDIIDIRNYQHSVDSINEIGYKEQIKAEIKNGKRKGLKRFVQGGAIGLGVGFIGGLILLK